MENNDKRPDWLQDALDADRLYEVDNPIFVPSGNPPAPVADKPKPEPIFKPLADVEPVPVPWLWQHWIPAGTLSLLDGDPGLGKSTLTLDLAARVSRGWAMPPDTGRELGRRPAGVLILGAEDSLSHTVRPRLDAAGADVSRVTYLDGFKVGDEVRDPVLPWDLHLLADWIPANGVRVVIVDPLMAFLSEQYDSHKDSDIRRCLRPLRDLAERLGIAILLLRHLNKLNGGASLYRGGGSIGMIGAARSAMIVGRDPEKPTRHVLAMNKCNLGPRPRSLAYTIEPEADVARIAWEEQPCDLTAADILWHAPTQARTGAPKSADAQKEAEDFLLLNLCKGPVSLLVLQEAAKATGLEWKAVQKARAKLGIKAQRIGLDLLWELPED
jgi:archaellum biogenesis ATPase FlaH